MKKRVVFFILVLLILLSFFSFVLAQNSADNANGEGDATDDTVTTTVAEEDAINNARQCIKEEIETDCSKLTYEEQVFSLLALGDYEDCKNEFYKNSDDNECWPRGNCKLKETSLALLALDGIGEDVTKIESWLLNQTLPITELIWYLEIDADSETKCAINYGGKSYSVTINEDKTIDSGAGSCLSKSENGFWLKISPSETCLENEYEISCDKDFITTLLYKTYESPTIYVSQNVNNNVANGKTTEKISFSCFQQGTKCDYEGSLWAAFALNSQGRDTSFYLPYLEAFASENRNYFPETFLYILTNEDVYFQSILNDNFKINFWQVGTYNRFYNTALAFLALRDIPSLEVERAKEYLLDNQGTNGCWGNIRDTGFLIYAGWREDAIISEPGPDAGPDYLDCQGIGYCLSSSKCSEIGGSTLLDYYCSAGKICCSKDYTLPSCVQVGYICDDINDECLAGNEIPSSSLETCCSVQCVPKQVAPITTYNCENQGPDYHCRVSCNEDEVDESSSFTCAAGTICCKKEERNLMWLVWVLLILIVLVILGIIFRRSLRLAVFRIKSKFSKGPVPKQGPRPLLPPRSPTPPRAFRPAYPFLQRQPTRQPARPSPKDKEFEETLRRLRELGK